MEQTETTNIVKPFVAFMKTRGWYSENIHGNQFQSGLPDSYFFHEDYTPRWIEFKVKRGNSIKLTTAQKKKFPVLIAKNVPVYIVASEDLRKRGFAFDEEKCKYFYAKILGKPNAHFALHKSFYKMLF